MARKSGEQTVGYRFTASLEANLQVGDVVMAPRGTTIYGRLASASSVRRISGSSELTLELTDIVMDGTAYVLFNFTFAKEFPRASDAMRLHAVRAIELELDFYKVISALRLMGGRVVIVSSDITIQFRPGVQALAGRESKEGNANCFKESCFPRTARSGNQHDIARRCGAEIDCRLAVEKSEIAESEPCQ
jgi:hypothetical protein